MMPTITSEAMKELQIKVYQRLKMRFSRERKSIKDYKEEFDQRLNAELEMEVRKATGGVQEDDDVYEVKKRPSKEDVEEYQREISKSGKKTSDQSAVILDELGRMGSNRPRWLDTDWMSIHDPEPSQERLPKVHSDLTHPRTVTLYMDERVCGGCGKVREECDCGKEKPRGKLSIW